MLRLLALPIALVSCAPTVVHQKIPDERPGRVREAPASVSESPTKPPPEFTLACDQQSETPGHTVWTDLAIDRDGHLYLTSSQRRLLISKDDGKTWRQNPQYIPHPTSIRGEIWGVESSGTLHEKPTVGRLYQPATATRWQAIDVLTPFGVNPDKLLEFGGTVFVVAKEPPGVRPSSTRGLHLWELRSTAPLSLAQVPVTGLTPEQLLIAQTYLHGRYQVGIDNREDAWLVEFTWLDCTPERCAGWLDDVLYAIDTNTSRATPISTRENISALGGRCLGQEIDYQPSGILVAGASVVVFGRFWRQRVSVGLTLVFGQASASVLSGGSEGVASAGEDLWLLGPSLRRRTGDETSTTQVLPQPPERR